jgi:endonuclease YncB( thermonuclease family)
MGEGKMKRRWVLFWVLCSYLFLLGPVAADERVRVNKVYDGDTIVLEDGRKVRYLGINSPEFQEPFYLKAKRLNESLVLGKEIRLEFDQERIDGYNRILAYVYAGDEMVNARLVKEGLAHVFLIGPSRRHSALLLQAQALAKQNRAGIWSARARPKDLKITNLHPADKDMPDPNAPYVRIANLSNGPVQMTGYVLSNESGQKYVFPEVRIDPGYTIIVSGAAGKDGVDDRGQLVVHWPAQGSAWDPREDTAFLTDPSGEIVDSFHYKGKRISASSRSRQKSP